MTDSDLVHAARTLAVMTQTEMNARIVNEFVGGTDVPDIAARYAVPEAYVDRVIEETSLAKPKRRDWSWNNWGNRLAYSILAGLAVNVVTGIYALGTTVTIILFVVTTAIVAARRS